MIHPTYVLAPGISILHVTFNGYRFIAFYMLRHSKQPGLSDATPCENMVCTVFFQSGYHYGIIWNNMGGINAVDDKLDMIMPDKLDHTSRCDVTQLLRLVNYTNQMLCSAQSWWNLAWLCNYILRFVHVHYNFQTSHNWVLIIIQNLVNYAIVRFHGRLSTRRPAGRKYAFFCFKEATGIMIMIIIHMEFLPQSAFQGTRRLWKHENSKADLSKLKNLRTQVPDIAIAIALFLLKHLLATFATTKLATDIFCYANPYVSTFGQVEANIWLFFTGETIFQWTFIFLHPFCFPRSNFFHLEQFRQNSPFCSDWCGQVMPLGWWPSQRVYSLYLSLSIYLFIYLPIFPSISISISMSISISEIYI